MTAAYPRCFDDGMDQLTVLMLLLRGEMKQILINEVLYYIPTGCTILTEYFGHVGSEIYSSRYPHRRPLIVVWTSAR